MAQEGPESVLNWGFVDIVFIVKIDGDDLEIVGHEAAVSRGG